MVEDIKTSQTSLVYKRSYTLLITSVGPWSLAEYGKQDAVLYINSKNSFVQGWKLESGRLETWERRHHKTPTPKPAINIWATGGKLTKRSTS